MEKLAIETEKWIAKVKIASPIDLSEQGISEIILRVLSRLIYGEDISEEMILKLQYFVNLHNKVFGYTSKPQV